MEINGLVQLTTTIYKGVYEGAWSRCWAETLIKLLGRHDLDKVLGRDLSTQQLDGRLRREKERGSLRREQLEAPTQTCQSLCTGS
jgi:hypothetical protein